MDKLRKVLSGEDNNSEDNSILSPVSLIQGLLQFSNLYSKTSVFIGSYYSCKSCLLIQSIFVDLYQVMDAATLSWSTRIKGFIICFVIGILLSLLGSVALFLHSGMAVFAVFYTLGNLTSMAR